MMPTAMGVPRYAKSFSTGDYNVVQAVILGFDNETVLNGSERCIEGNRKEPLT